VLTVLFVCTGNICRSPLAEGFLADRSHRFLDDAVVARSAGTWARGGDPPVHESVLVARERGIDISHQRCAPLTAQKVRRADLIVGMTEEHVEEIVRLDPGAAEKTFTLKELASILSTMPPPAPGADPRPRITEADDRRSPEHRGDVRDPLGLGEATYRDVAWEIEAAVDGIVAGLFGTEDRPAAAEG
jgi:protein-tyrosine phosphatase